MRFFDNLRDFFKGAFDYKAKSVEALSLQYEHENEEFFILCFSDLLGIDLPVSYYALELYPFLAEEIEKWQKNSHDRRSVWDSRSGDFDA